MGWNRDWLYQAIFKEFRRAWDKAQREGSGPHGPASTKLVVFEFHAADLEGPHCRGNRVRAWAFAGDDFQELPQAEAEVQRSGEITGMFYKTATGAFHIASDRKRVVVEYWFGPLYGRGFQFGVRGQGKTCRLAGVEDARSWIS
jgi:hypothetical protein